MIYYCLNNIFITIFFIDMVERRFPNEFKYIIIETSLNCIYIYSIMQIFLLKINKKIKNILDYFIIYNTERITTKEFIKDGQIINIKDESETNIDFILYSWLNYGENCVNKQIIYDLNKPITITEYSNIKFILIELKLENNLIYKIDLKTDEYNYYLVGNKITKKFFIYYLKKYLNININNEKLILKILDNNINSIELEFSDKNKGILLEKNNYKIVDIDE